jgi:PAS domain-containing protein
VLVIRDTEFGSVIGSMHDGGVYRYVHKPCPPGALLRAVQEAADYHALVQSERRLREQLTRVNAELESKVRDLDEANELLEYWVEFSPAVLYSLSNDGGTLRTSYISKNFARLTGFERTEAVVDPAFWRRLVLPAHVAAYERALEQLGIGDGNHAVLEYAIRHRDGATVTVVDAMRAVRDGDGLTVEIVGAWLDVSGRA